MKQAIILFFLVAIVWNLCAQSRNTIYLWPHAVPGETEVKHPARVSDNTSRNVTRLSEVTNPALVVFEADRAVANGGAIIVCPGGGYSILAVDLEGYEVAEWLKSLGYTAFVLQYRVPKKQAGALMDLQRAMRMVRKDAERWKIDANKIGVMGFSAGGSLCARASTRYLFKSYDDIDTYDRISAKPDFAILIYPAYLDQGEGGSLTPELLVNSDTPPMFLFATADDRFTSSSLVMATALRKAKVSVELHILPVGGHGYGLRPGNRAAETWPLLLHNWLESGFNSETKK